jgi:hypothetical protein
VITSLAHVGRYIIPGLFCGVLSAILSAVNQGNDDNFVLNRLADRNHMGQGGYQMVGLALSTAFGIGVGLLLGLLFKLVNRNTAREQFNDGELYRPDFPPALHLIDWK